MTEFASTALVVAGGLALVLTTVSALAAAAPAQPEPVPPTTADGRPPSDLPGGLELYDGPLPVAQLKVLELRRLAARHRLGSSYLRSSGRRRDLLEILYRAGVTHG